MSDTRLAGVVADAAPLGTGIGGNSSELEVGGIRTFVKRIPLTDIELRPPNVRSTANHFGLPTSYHYGIGSAGFGAWRELAVHVMTTTWVLANRYPGFPVMYHWRVLPDSAPQGVADEFGGVDGAVAYWENSPAVRERLEAIGRSRVSLVLFLEHVPQTLRAGAPREWWDAELVRGAAFMSSHGLVHFDAHFDNILTDGELIYFADFGLALSSAFDRSRDEADFLAEHLSYDHASVASKLLRRLVEEVRGGQEHDAFLRGWIAGRRPATVQPPIAMALDRHARTAVVLDGFHHRLLTASKRTPFPSADIESARARPTGVRDWIR